MRSRSSFDGGARTISFGNRLASSPSFANLFREGMGLVEEVAAYLDGGGREESKALSRMVALGYASESMRLTTRLMQLASWLLLQRAVNEGEMTQVQAAAEKHKVRLTRQGLAAAPELFEQLPERLKQLSLRSLRLQDRVMHFDRLIDRGLAEAVPADLSSPIAAQLERVRIAFERHA
ncbi:MAG: DUF1465 family protein [Methylobacteriaceae bacterium]|nr:DUF1465 family protein [Methylobacteriaceae bacterium]